MVLFLKIIETFYEKFNAPKQAIKTAKYKATIEEYGTECKQQQIKQLKEEIEFTLFGESLST
jgi:S-methylmethionine-dependent homocysteine/selenocysteine methylase